MNADGLVRAIKRAIAIRQPLLIKGDSGIGKTQVVHQVGAEMSHEVIVWNAALYDSVDFRGIPHAGKDGLTHWLPPAFLPRSDKPTIVFADEINRGSLSVQNSLFRIIECGRLGDYVMPDACKIIAACNPRGRGVVPMPKPLKKRFVQVTLEVDVDAWCRWASKHLKPVTVAFIRFRRELLHKPDHLSEQDDASACPRTWEYLDSLIPAIPDEDIDYEMYAGCVGDGTALEFMAFAKVFEQTQGLIPAIMSDPLTAPVPKLDDPAMLYAVSSALSRMATVKTFGRICQYANRLPSEEYAAYCISDATRRDVILKGTPAYTKFKIEHSGLDLN